MKQIEITVRLDENMQSAISKLENQGFKKIRQAFGLPFKNAKND